MLWLLAFPGGGAGAGVCSAPIPAAGGSGGDLTLQCVLGGGDVCELAN